MRRIVAFAILAALMLLQSGCGFLQVSDTGEDIDIDVGGAARRGTASVQPRTKPDGSRYTLAYVDIDPYPMTGSILYYIIMGLREEGWITFDSLPFDPADTDAGALIDWLAARDIGPYIRFDSSANYYLEFQSEQEIYESLSAHVRNGTIDLILTMGTWPAAMVKSFGLDFPIMMFGSTNPVGSGLIDSLEDSGDPNIWATFDPTVYERQLLYYYSCVPFSNIGIVFYDESIANVASYERAAGTLGVKVTRSPISRIDTSSEESTSRYYAELAEEFKRLISREGIDAFMLTTDIIVDVERTDELLEIFTANGIPAFVQAGDVFVQHGGLMNVSAIEIEGQGLFSARSITRALTGTPLSEIQQEYRNSPFLVLNLDTAEKIGYKPTFETLLACERVYTAG